MQPDAAAANGDDKCKRKAGQEIQKADGQHSGDHFGKISRIYLTRTQPINGKRGITRRDGDMPDVEMDAKDLAKKTRHTEKETKTDVADQRAGMFLHIIGDTLQPRRGQGKPENRMGLQPPADMTIFDLILYIPRNDPAEEKKYPRVTGVQQGKAMPGMLILQHLQRRGAFYQLPAKEFVIAPGQQPDTGKNDEEVSDKGSDLAAADPGHSHGQVV